MHGIHYSNYNERQRRANITADLGLITGLILNHWIDNIMVLVYTHKHQAL